MISYHSKVTITRPPEAVFPYLVERDKQALWTDVPMRPLTEGEPRAGSRMELTFGKGPLKVTIGLELTAVEPNSRLAFESFSGPIGWKGEYRLSPSGTGGSELSQEGSLTFRGLWRLIQPLVGAEISRGEVKELERLKAIVEKS